MALFAVLTPERIRALNLYEVTGVTTCLDDEPLPSAILKRVQTERALRRLTRDEEIAIRMMVEDFTQREIARELGIGLRKFQYSIVWSLWRKLYGEVPYEKKWPATYKPLAFRSMHSECPAEYFLP